MKVFLLIGCLYKDYRDKINYGFLEHFIETNSIESADEDFSNLDKTELMFDKNIDLIINWEINGYNDSNGDYIDIRNKRIYSEITNIVKELYNRNVINSETVFNIYAIYDKLKDVIKNYKIEEQLTIILYSLNISYTAISSILTDILNELKNKKLEK